MIRIAILGDIGSGKSFIARKFGYPVFNADYEVAKIYRKNWKCYCKLKKIFPTYITSFPVKKKEIIKVILANRNNLNKINEIVHPQVRAGLYRFVKKNYTKKIIILDIPLFMENKMNKKNDILIFIDSQKKEVRKRLKKKFNKNREILKKFKKLQLALEIKKKKADYIIKNNFKDKSAKKNVKKVLGEILINA
tara:strand:- start:179 stop:757 length:579 start_codon:yes stop_codon:yes gene_type:complete